MTASAGTPNVTVSGRTITRNPDSSLTVAITLKNSGTGVATGVQLTSVNLRGTNAPGIPLSVPEITVGGTQTITVNFPNLAAGNTNLIVAGTYTGGSFNTTTRVTIP